MSETIKAANGGTDHKQVASQGPLSTAELRDFKNVTNNLMQDALNVWADLWAELEGPRFCLRQEDTGVSGVTVKPESAEDGFEPSCGWNQFLEKMWVLRHYLDFTKRLSQQ
jgi:hypothetical protein